MSKSAQAKFNILSFKIGAIWELPCLQVGISPRYENFSKHKQCKKDYNYLKGEFADDDPAR
jgi:hypothetical protein